MNSALQLHCINRLSYGLRPSEWKPLDDEDLENYLQEQLNPATLSHPPFLRQELQKRETLTASPTDLFQTYYPPNAGKLTPEERKELRKRRQEPFQQAREARVLRAIYSPRQLQEVMVDFWFNHFNVFGRRGALQIWVGTYEEQAIRPYVLGNFRDLLGAVARHPAMLLYLDNWVNTDPNSPRAKGKFKGLNENYARELLELHTLGVDGDYRQADVIALAQILTGWGINRRGKLGDGSGFHFYKARHDHRDKVFLGRVIAGDGISEVENVLDILATHPDTARHLSYKLAQYFVSDDPPAPLVNRLAEQFLRTRGEIRPVLELLFDSSEFRDPKFYKSKFRTPYQYLLAVLRATEIKTSKYNGLLGILRQMGMGLYECRPPNGYTNTKQAWLSSDAMMKRVTLASTFSKRFAKGNQKIDPKLLKVSLGQLSAQTEATLKTAPSHLQIPLLLGSPEMMHY
ncbi:MAG: DUF1800 domain-containing protein [Halothece sp. Uz-M2-17]|nr:DUF1800 domain-containing protein [Halothece sp. Uz-M2-17]